MLTYLVRVSLTLASLAVTSQAIAQDYLRPPTYERNRLTRDIALRQLDSGTSKAEIAQYSQMQNYGTCLTRTGRSFATKLMDEVPGSVDERNMFMAAQDRFKGCPMATGSPSFFMLRGTLAEAGYKIKYKATAAPPPSADPQALASFMSAQSVRLAGTPDGLGAASGAMTCAAATTPQTAHAVIHAKHGSVEEATAMQKLWTEAAACPAIDAAKGLSLSQQRAFLAQGAYRWASSQPQS